ncbi:MAG: hypothetical protein M0R39_15180 [Prolixibacteraceae bacterium]|jgi:hypothetical protein|nr:hypothetical protein [Prolixibacteraceae bacterium]
MEKKENKSGRSFLKTAAAGPVLAETPLIASVTTNPPTTMSLALPGIKKQPDRMNRGFRVMRNVIWILVFALMSSVQVYCGPLGTPGTVARYKLLADPVARPEFEKTNKLTVVTAWIQTGPTVKWEDGKTYQWYGLRWARLNGEQCQMWALMDSWPKDGHPTIVRYIWDEPKLQGSVEYVHESTGEAVLPRNSIWDYSLPRTSDNKDVLKINRGIKFPEEIMLLGWKFGLESVRTGQEVSPPVDPYTIRLNPDLFIGLFNGDRDSSGQPYDRSSKIPRKYQANNEDDLKAYQDAGYNMHQARFHPDWVWRSPMYSVNMQWNLEDWPAYIYRSNYWGRASLLDEPAIQQLLILDRDTTLAGKLTPAEAAKRLEDRTVETTWNAAAHRNYANSVINEFIDKQFGRGDLTIIEKNYPSWEAIWPTAWYQLAPAKGPAGIVDEDADPDGMAGDYNQAFGTQIPNTVESACAIRTAVLRGAARSFNKLWGIAMYNPSYFKCKASSIPYFYDRGATYFWYWNGWQGISDNSGLPFSFQRMYASIVRQAYLRNPNRDMNGLLNKAKVCVLIPYGYTFAPYQLQDLKWLHLEKINEKGITYRQILANAAVEVENLIRNSVEFDIAVDEPRFNPKGYDEMIYCQEDGKIRIVRPKQSDEMLASPRTPKRPDLGPLPQLTIQTDSVPSNVPGTVKLRAIPTIGSGKFHESGNPWVRWEVYTPNQGVLQIGGSDASFKAKQPGLYRIRASVNDIFGRAVVAQTEFTLRDSR